MSPSVESRESSGFGFAVFLTLFVGLLVGLALSYSPTSGLIPLVIGIPTLVILLLVTASYRSPRANRLTAWFDTALFAVDTELIDDDETDDIQAGALYRGIGWTVGFFVSCYLVGIVLSTPFFIYAFLQFEGDHGRRPSLLVAVGTTVFVIVLFEFILGTLLYPGAIPIAVQDHLGW